MNEEWWGKLRSETVRDRLPGAFLIVKVGVLAYFVLLACLLLLLPWHKATQPAPVKPLSLTPLLQQAKTQGDSGLLHAS